MCSSDLSDVKDKMIGVRLFYRSSLVKDGNSRSSDSTTTAYAVVSRSDITGLSANGLLPAGHYRCRFLVNGKLVRARSFAVRSLLAQASIRYHYPRLATRISAIPGASIDPNDADATARRGMYSAWVALADDHVADVAIWPSLSAAKSAVKRYRAGGPDARPPRTIWAWPHVLRRVDRIRNVTLAWYTPPSKADEAAFRIALRVGSVARGQHDYRRMWAIPGVFFDPNVTGQGALFQVRLILAGGCNASGCSAEGGGCVPSPSGNDLYVEIWPSVSTAKNDLQQSQDILNPGERMERIRNATIDWNCHPTSADEALVKAAFTY
jgi:hypothetical protein